MASKCDFCQNKLKVSEGFNVKEIVIDKNPGIIKLTDVLLDLFFCDLDATKICPECMETISKQFIFKQKLRKNIQMPSSNVIVQISKFLSKTKETISTSEHLDVLSVFPERRKKFVETIQNFSPEVCVISATVERVLPKSESISKIAPSIIYKKSVTSSSSETESNDSNYGDNKSSRKRKKASTKARNSNSAKKQKHNSIDSIVKKEPITKNYKESKKREFSRDHKNISIIRAKQSGNVLDSSRLNQKLTGEQAEWIKNTMESTERNGIYYSCKFCFKDLKSNSAMRYHYENRHLLKKLTKKQVWVAHKIKEGIMQVKREDGGKMTQWKCSECSRIYNNQPGIRYHLTKHLKDDFDEVLEISETNY